MTHRNATEECLDTLWFGFPLSYGQAARFTYEIEDALPHRLDYEAIGKGGERHPVTAMIYTQYEKQLDGHKDLWLNYNPVDKLAARMNLVDAFIRNELDARGREEVYTTLLGPKKAFDKYAIADFHKALHDTTYERRIKDPSWEQAKQDLLSHKVSNFWNVLSACKMLIANSFASPT